MRARWCVALSLSGVFLLCGAVLGDEVVLRSGGAFQGDITSKSDSQVVLQTAYGSVTFEMADVLEVRYASAVEKEIRAGVMALAPDDVDGRLKWALTAAEAGLAELARSIYTQVIALSPDNEAARRQLGYVRFEGEWVTVRDKSLHPGMVPYRGNWVTPEERDKLRAGEEAGQYLASFNLPGGEGAAILQAISDVDLVIEPRGGYIVRRHVRTLPVKDKPYVYSVDILNWQRLGVWIGVSFIDGSRKRIEGIGELEYTIHATEADALGNRRIGAALVSGKVTITPEMWGRRADFKYWDTKVNESYEAVIADDAKRLWNDEYYMNYDSVLYVLANRDMALLSPPGVYYVEAALTVKDLRKKAGRFVQYAELR